MEILTDPSVDGLAMNQWAIQTLVWAYRARFPEAPPRRSVTNANIAYLAIVEKVQGLRAWQPEEAVEFNLAIVHWLIQAALGVQQDQTAIRGICRFCGCTARFGCVISQKGFPPVTCCWHDDACTICSALACSTRAKPGPAVFLPPPASGDSVHPAVCTCQICRTLEEEVIRP